MTVGTKWSTGSKSAVYCPTPTEGYCSTLKGTLAHCAKLAEILRDDAWGDGTPIALSVQKKNGVPNVRSLLSRDGVGTATIAVFITQRGFKRRVLADELLGVPTDPKKGALTHPEDTAADWRDWRRRDRERREWEEMNMVAGF